MSLVRRHQNKIERIELRDVAAEVARTACAAREGELEFGVVMPHEVHALVPAIDVMPVLAGRLADKFASEHDDDSVRDKVGNLAVVPKAVNICYTLELIPDNLEPSDDFRHRHPFYSHVVGCVRNAAGDLTIRRFDDSTARRSRRVWKRKQRRKHAVC